MPPKGARRVGRKLTSRSKKSEKRKLDDSEESNVHSTRDNARKTRNKSTPDPIESEGTGTSQMSPEAVENPLLTEEQLPPQTAVDSQEYPRSPTPPPQEPSERNQLQCCDEDGDNAPSQPQPKPVLDKEKGSKGKGKRLVPTSTSPPPTQYSFTEAQEEDIANWIKTKPQLYNIKNKAYKDKGARRQLWEDKGAEYRVNHETICKWYYTQRKRFLKLSEGQPKCPSKKRSGDGFDSEEDEDLTRTEVSENDSQQDAIIRRIFGFLRSHIRRVGKNTPASFKEKLALAETGELLATDEEGVIPETSQPSKRYSGLPTPRRARTKTPDVSELDPTECSTLGMGMKETSTDIQDRLVQYITRETAETRSAPFCRYLESDLEKLHETCWEPAVQDMTDVLRHYQKVSRQLRIREARGEVVSPQRYHQPSCSTSRDLSHLCLRLPPTSALATYSVRVFSRLPLLSLPALRPPRPPLCTNRPRASGQLIHLRDQSGGPRIRDTWTKPVNNSPQNNSTTKPCSHWHPALQLYAGVTLLH